MGGHPRAGLDGDDEEPAMARFLDMGVDGIMTDRPTLLKDLLIRRGQWHGA
jgi:glycerophosphoryl diester phosphodiesterase